MFDKRQRDDDRDNKFIKPETVPVMAGYETIIGNILKDIDTNDVFKCATRNDSVDARTSAKVMLAVQLLVSAGTKDVFPLFEEEMPLRNTDDIMATAAMAVLDHVAQKLAAQARIFITDGPEPTFTELKQVMDDNEGIDLVSAVDKIHKSRIVERESRLADIAAATVH